MEIITFINSIIFGVLGAVKGTLASVGSDWAASIGSLGTLYFTIKNYKTRNKENKKQTDGRS